MSTAQTVGETKVWVNDVLYMVPDPVAERIDSLLTEVRDAFSDGFWCGYDAPAALPKSYVDKAFAERNQKPVKARDSGSHDG